MEKWTADLFLRIISNFLKKRDKFRKILHVFLQYAILNLKKKLKMCSYIANYLGSVYKPRGQNFGQF